MNALHARFDLVTVQSPSVDRRALSQAWYSALHIAGRSPRARCAFVCHPEHQRGTAKWWQGCRGPSLRASATPYARDDKWGERHLERRRPTSRLASEIVERVKSNLSATRFVIESARGRVIVHVVRRDDRVHLAAICGESVRGEVEKALAQARFALAGMGVQVR